MFNFGSSSGGIYNTADRHQFERSRYDLDERRRRFRRAVEAYHGRYRDHLKPTVNAKTGQRFNDNVKINHARIIVDVGVDFLFGRGVTWQVAEGQDTPEEQYLAQVWKANRKMQTLARLAQNGAMHGQAFVKVEPALPGVREFPTVRVLDPATVEPTYSADDIDLVERYVIQYTAQPIDGKVTTYRQTHTPVGNPAAPSGWLIVDERSIGSGPWELVGETMWPYGWPQIAHCQNLPCANEWWGVADLETDVLDLIDAVNYSASNGMRIFRFYAHQRLVGIGLNATQLSNVDTAIGAVAAIPPGSDIKPIDPAANVGDTTAYVDALEDRLYQVARVPRVAAGKIEDIGALSGVAMRILYQPLLAKTALKRETYGELTEEVNQRLLELGGRPRSATMATQWPELLPVDAKAESEAYAIQLSAGVVSRETASTNLGYDWQVERQRLDIEELGLPPDATPAEIEAAKAEREQQRAQQQAAALAAAATEQGVSGGPGSETQRAVPARGGTGGVDG